jgi:hypothetical protein
MEENITNENLIKVANLKNADLANLFSTTGALELELFDIQIPNRYGKIGSIIRKIDNGYGVFGSLSYIRYSTSKLYSEIQSKDFLLIKRVDFLDVDGGPYINRGTILEVDNEKIEITDIFLKHGYFIIFYNIIN